MPRCWRCSGGTSTEASDSVCEISAAQFFGGVLAHALKWKPQFDGGMEASIPYAERRQVDMAKVRRSTTNSLHPCSVMHTMTWWCGSKEKKGWRLILPRQGSAEST